MVNFLSVQSPTQTALTNTFSGAYRGRKLQSFVMLHSSSCFSGHRTLENCNAQLKILFFIFFFIFLWKGYIINLLYCKGSVLSIHKFSSTQWKWKHVTTPILLLSPEIFKKRSCNSQKQHLQLSKESSTDLQWQTVLLLNFLVKCRRGISFVSVHIFSWEYMNKICDTIHPYSVSSFHQTIVCWSYTAALFYATALRKEERNKLTFCTMTRVSTDRQPTSSLRKKTDKSSDGCSKSSYFFRLQLCEK